MNPQSEKLILAAANPGNHFYAVLAKEIESLVPSAQSQKLKSRNPFLTGNLDEVVAAVVKVIAKDWSENTAQKVPWKFEYQLLRLTMPVDHVQVLTRLFSPPDPQSIYYGREIARISPNEFIVWVSD